MKLTEKTIAALPVPADKPQVLVTDDDTPGFGVVVGSNGSRTFVVRYRVKGSDKRVKATIGVWRAQHPDGGEWTLIRARERAKELIGAGVPGRSAHVVTAGQATGPTLRDGLVAHVARMRAKRRAERSIATLEHEVTKYAASWLDRPIAELSGVVLSDLHASIKANAQRREGTNPNNATGAALANRVIASVSACWSSLNRKLEGQLGSWNPAKAVDRDVLAPKRVRLVDLVAWLASVDTITSPIKRDGLRFALYTGLRHEDVRNVRWDDVDLDARTLRLPDPKGGEARAFTLPLSSTPLEILRRRRSDNALALGRSDNGYVFPGANADDVIGPIDDLRQKVRIPDVDGEITYARVPAEDVHTLRRTYLSIATEEGISEIDTHVLSNHSFGSHNVNATYISQHLDHLARCAQKIDDGITRRLTTPTPSKRSKSHA